MFHFAKDAYPDMQDFYALRDDFNTAAIFPCRTNVTPPAETVAEWELPGSLQSIWPL
jgi:hypothetical protein